MSEASEVLGFVTGLLVLFAFVLAVLWTLLPFAVFGVEGLLKNILDQMLKLNRQIEEVRRATSQLPTEESRDSERTEPAPGVTALGLRSRSRR